MLYKASLYIMICMSSALASENTSPKINVFDYAKEKIFLMTQPELEDFEKRAFNGKDPYFCPCPDYKNCFDVNNQMVKDWVNERKEQLTKQEIERLIHLTNK